MNTALNRICLTADCDNIDFEQAKQLALQHALVDNEYAMVISWWDRKAGKHSPQCLK